MQLWLVRSTPCCKISNKRVAIRRQGQEEEEEEEEALELGHHLLQRGLLRLLQVQMQVQAQAMRVQLVEHLHLALRVLQRRTVPLQAKRRSQQWCDHRLPLVVDTCTCCDKGGVS